MSNPEFATWHKSRRSSGGDNCVEVSFSPDGTVGIRDSKDPSGPILTFTPGEWDAFVEGVADGEFHL